MFRLWTLAVIAALSAACSGTDVKLTCQKDSDCFQDEGYVCDTLVVKGF